MPEPITTCVSVVMQALSMDCEFLGSSSYCETVDEYLTQPEYRDNFQTHVEFLKSLRQDVQWDYDDEGDERIARSLEQRLDRAIKEIKRCRQ